MKKIVIFALLLISALSMSLAKGKGIPTIVTIISDKEELEKGDLKSEVGDFITLKKDTQFTEFSITINKNTFNKSSQTFYGLFFKH